jgi:hypothetical protein
MARVYPGRFVLGLVIGLWPLAAHAEEQYRYHYVNLDTVTAPSGLPFSPSALHASGRVYGSVCDADANCNIASYAGGTLTVFGAQGFAGVVNGGGTVGGGVLLDLATFDVQAALFRRDSTELIPRQPGEVFASVVSINDAGTALVQSFDPDSHVTNVLYSKGSAAIIDFGPLITRPEFLNFVGDGHFINNQGILAGINGGRFTDATGFRFNPRTGAAMLLAPVSPDTLAWGLAINNRGDVLGYSFVLGRPYHERVGVWDSAGTFHTYIDETISTSNLVFNDNNLIAISLAPGNIGYLVPRPGVRLDLRTLVVDMPPGADLRLIYDINNRGDLLGSGSAGNYLLERLP